MQSERDHKAALTVQKVPVLFHGTTNKDSICYMKYLTPYAYQYVQEQILLKDKLRPKDACPETFLVSASEGEVTVILLHQACTCMYWLSLKLPCRHIFAARPHFLEDL